MTQDYWTVVVALVVFLVVVGLMVLGWKNRVRRQSGLFDELPQLPADPGEIVLGPQTGVYIGSTEAGDWQARIARAPLGHRSPAELTAHTGGIRLDLADATVWIPRADLVGLHRTSALANKTVPGGGILAVRWHVAGESGTTTVIDTGFRADDKDTYPRWEALHGDAADPTDTAADSTEEKQ